MNLLRSSSSSFKICSVFRIANNDSGGILRQIRNCSKNTNKASTDMSAFINVLDCHHRKLYKLKSSYIDFGVFNSDDDSFIGIMDRSNKKYFHREYHAQALRPENTAFPLELIGDCPVKDLDETLGIVDRNTGRPVEYAQRLNGWRFIGESETSHIIPVGIPNEDLFDFLDKYWAY